LNLLAFLFNLFYFCYMKLQFNDTPKGVLEMIFRDTYIKTGNPIYGKVDYILIGDRVVPFIVYEYESAFMDGGRIKIVTPN